MEINAQLSCDGFLPVDSTSSSNQTGLNCPCPKLCPSFEKPQAKAQAHDIRSNKCPSIFDSNSTSSMSSGFLQQNCNFPKPSITEAPNIDYELAIAKSIMQQYSTISGDNLFDHLSDIIKRIIDERPPNVIDFFEEFSRSVREQKLHLPERFPPDGIFEESSMYKVAKKQLMSMKLPSSENLDFQTTDEDMDDEEEQNKLDDLKLDHKSFGIFHTEHIQHLQFYWNQCGFSISSDDIFQLACSMDRLQTHPSIMQCRFWGVINGLKASYYVVEAMLTNEECESRLEQMEREIIEAQTAETEKETKLPLHIGPELIPGSVGWENYPEQELLKMKPHALPVPLVKAMETFDVPPEPIGTGLNRYVYFVVNTLSDDWIELPIVTPKQINISRQIKKFLTGDLEADVISYPFFPGKEKHYLRAMISRITAGTYIAPNGYYRKMTKKEKHLFESSDKNEIDDEEEEESNQSSDGDEDEEEGEEKPDNDIVLLRNEKFDSTMSLNILNNTSKWVHVRPNILQQGRVGWYDEEKALRDKEKQQKRLDKLQASEETNEEEQTEEEESDDESENSQNEEFESNPEIGPAILTPCSRDTNEELTIPWTRRFTSKFTNKNERILMMQSNVWPGAYTFVYENLCDSIYLGFGHKYVARNMQWHHLPNIAQEYPHRHENFVEASDPTVEMEEAYRLSLLKKDLITAGLNEHLGDDENETHESEDEEEGEEEDEEEE